MQFVQEDPIHPGLILAEDFIAEYALSPSHVAAEIGVETIEIEQLLAGAVPMTAELALRLSRYFENSPEFWLNLQRAYDLALAMKSASGLEKIRPIRAA